MSAFETLYDAEIVKETDKAFLVRLPNKEETFIPKSMCLEPETLEEGSTDFEVKRWFIEKDDALSSFYC